MHYKTFIPGVPAPQGSKRTYGRRVIEDNPRTKPWRETMRKHHLKTSQAVGAPLIVGAFQASLRFVFTEPKSGALYQGTLDPIHAVKPDIDKLTRAVMDSLTSGGIIEDDARCNKLEAVKEYGENPGVHIHLTQIYNERKR
nr:MAG TPA: Endodeoxyribonuclease RusA [Caudoviricetes sp.]